MNYTKHEFKSGEKLYAQQLNEMDEQIHENTEAIEKQKKIIKELPILEETYVDTADKLTLVVNIDELESNILYKASYDPHKIVIVKYILVCSDGSKKTVIAAENAFNIVQITRDDTQGFISLVFDNVVYKVSYGDKSTADVVTVEKLYNQNYLGITNSIEFVPTGDYQPVPKKYVDDECRKLSEDIADLKENQPTTGRSGWTKAQIDLLDEIGNYIPFTTADGGKRWDDLITLLRGGESEEPDTPTDATVTSISATYTGGEVATGTALSALTGITVTATYSDGTTKVVTGYTLSGDIVEGENEITVSYGGFTTTFEVVGIVESGGEVTAELITDGLVDYFDFRTCEYNNTASGGATTISATQGTGQLYAWANNCVASQNEYGLHASNSREWLYDKNGGTTQSDLGTEFTAIQFAFKGVGCGVEDSNLPPNWAFKPYYVDKSGNSKSFSLTNGAELNSDDKTDYNFIVYRVNGLSLTQIMDSSVINHDASEVEDFASWKSKVSGSIFGYHEDAYVTAFAVYNRALSDVEIEEMRAFFKTLEVA